MNLIQAARKDLILQKLHILFFFNEEVEINSSKCIAFGFYLNGDLFKKYYVTRETLNILYGVNGLDFWTIDDFLNADDSIKDIVIVPAPMTEKGTPNIVFKDKILSMNPVYSAGSTIEEQTNQIKQSFRALPVKHFASTVELLNNGEHIITGTAW